jgi:hypothetical protein
MPTHHDIFISHSSKDTDLAAKLVDVLLTNGCDVSVNRILCTSLEGMKIPPGTPSFIEFLRQEIQHPKLVVLLLTDNYFASTFCVCELGAAWGMGLNTFPLLVPPLDKGDLKGTLKVTQAGSILDGSYLDELRDSVIDLLGEKVKTSRWNLKRDEFLKAAPRIISKLPKPSTVDRTKLEEVEQNYQGSLEEIDAKNEEIETLQAQIAELEKVKDAEKVRTIKRKYTGHQEQFDALCKEAEATLEPLNSATCSALYWSLRRISYQPEGEDEWGDARKADSINEVTCLDDGTCSPNDDHPRVRKADRALEKLANFIRDMEFEKSSFFKDFAEEHEYPLNLGNKEFWGQYLAYV